MKHFISLILIASILSCTNEPRARRVLEESGYTSYDYGGCADSDSTCTGFRATSPRGHTVEGAVGCGYGSGGCGKGCTVRLQ